MELGLSRKPVLVTGATSEFGRSIALRLASCDARVMMFASSEPDLVETQSAIAKQCGNKPLYCVGDAAVKSDIEQCVEETFCQFGSVYSLVNNSDIPRSSSFYDLGDAEWQSVFESTILSYVRTIRAVLPLMEKSRQGRIVNNAIFWADGSGRLELQSGIWSHAITSLSKSISHELESEGILINSIAITIGSGAQDDHPSAGGSSSCIQCRADSTHLVRGNLKHIVQEVANRAAFLASSENSGLAGLSCYSVET